MSPIGRNPRGGLRLGPLAVAAVWMAILVAGGGESLAVVPAFPTAEGEGMWATGGRGGNVEVYHVTNLSNSGPGSLRYGVTTGTVPRIVVFDVCGTIINSNSLHITRPNITIAGQTAPGLGIEIYNYGTAVTADNVILQHLHLRPGDAVKGPDPGYNNYGLLIDGQNIIIDHCSTSWSISQAMDVDGSGFADVTVQYCTIAEALAQTGLFHGEWNANYNPGGPSYHGNGLFVKPMEGVSGTSTCTAHHNLLADNTSRNPCPGVYNSTQSVMFDFRNNVIYNCRNSGYSSGGGSWVKMNYVGNYLVAGPSTTSGSKAFDANAQCNVSIYQSGNKVDSDKDSLRDGVTMTWSSFQGPYTQLGSPVAMEAVTTETADAAYANVLAHAGAFWWNRDLVDRRIVNDANTNTGMYINSQKDRKDPNGILTDPNGYLTILETHRDPNWDTDQDGMPKFWETWYGSNPSTYDPNGDRDGDGYLDLEEYLVWIYDPNSIHRPGDATCDNAVAFSDLSVLASNWSQTGKSWQDGDFNNNGTVDFTDLSILSSNWGWSGTPPSPAPVPEPATLILLTAGGSLALMRRRQR